MYKVIVNNPFRILGVCANSSLKDIVANKGKMNAFLKVGKNISFQLDMTNVLGEIDRTIDTITAADTQLTIKADKLRAAQLWFFKIDDIDKEAFDEIGTNNLNKAIAKWEQRDTMSSLQNRAIVYFALDNIEQATKMLSMVYDFFLNDFINALGSNHNITYQELVDNIVLTILEQKPDIDFKFLASEQCTEKWREAAKQPYVQMLIQKLNNAVEESENKTNSHNYIIEGRKLLDYAKPIINNLIRLLPSEDAQLVSISDKVFKEILECVKAETYYRKEEAFLLLVDASTLALGALTKHKLSEELAKFTQHDEVPSKTPDEEESRILNELDNQLKTRSTLQEASLFIDAVWNDIITLGQKRGADDPTYISLSSKIVRAALNKINDDIDYRYRNIHLSSNIRDIKYGLSKAIEIIERIWQMDIDDNTRELLQKYYTTYTNSYNKVLESVENEKGDDNENCGCLIIKIIIGIAVAIKFIHHLFF